MLESVSVVVPAAGKGVRMGASLSKQYLPLLDKPVLQHTLEKLLALSPRQLVLVVSADDDHWRQLPATADCHVVQGAESRAGSVLRGLAAVAADGDDWVMVHDAVRPCFRASDVSRLLAAVAGSKVGGLLGVPVSDTLKRVNGHRQVAATEPREAFWLAQTPQLFRLGLLKDALSAGSADEITDEASAMENRGHAPLMVQGSKYNIKLTTPEDLHLAEMMLREERRT